MGAIDPATKRGEITDGGRECHRPRWFRERARGDEGAALVEFALLLPFLAIVAFGTIDLGRAYQMRNRLTNAAREGAIYGQFHACDTDDIEQVVGDEDPELTSLPGYAVTLPSTCPAPGSDLEVTVSATMDVFTPLIGNITGETITLRGRSTVVVQG